MEMESRFGLVRRSGSLQEMAAPIVHVLAGCACTEPDGAIVPGLHALFLSFANSWLGMSHDVGVSLVATPCGGCMRHSMEPIFSVALPVCIDLHPPFARFDFVIGLGFLVQGCLCLSVLLLFRILDNTLSDQFMSKVVRDDNQF